MKNTAIAAVILAAVIVAATIVLAQQPSNTTSSSGSSQDPRIDKIIEQNNQILKNQQDMQKELDDIKEGILQVRRRTS